MSKRGQRNLLPRLSASTITSIGRLDVFVHRLRRAVESIAPTSADWTQQAEALIAEAGHVLEAMSEEETNDLGIVVVLADGTGVLVDRSHIEGLVQKIHRHLMLRALALEVDDPPVTGQLSVVREPATS